MGSWSQSLKCFSGLHDFLFAHYNPIDSVGARRLSDWQFAPTWCHFQHSSVVTNGVNTKAANKVGRCVFTSSHCNNKGNDFSAFNHSSTKNPKNSGLLNSTWRAIRGSVPCSRILWHTHRGNRTADNQCPFGSWKGALTTELCRPVVLKVKQ